MNPTTPSDQIFAEIFDRRSESAFDQPRDDAVCLSVAEAGGSAGFDNVAAEATNFEYRGTSFREDMIARQSGSTARHRTLTCALSMTLFGTPSYALPAVAAIIALRKLRLYIAENTTPLSSGLAKALPPKSLVRSEYFGERHRSGTSVGGVRHEDLQHLSLDDASCDIVVTSEVLEHVPDPLRAEREIVRILQRGGYYVFTVPLDPVGTTDTILAERLADGSHRFYGEPVYHGDPLRSEGILAYRIFSIAGLEERFAKLGCTMTTYRFWSPALGIVGTNSFVHVARKLRAV
ncbi:MAG: methyltransferase domain-containing protein [Candidatus Elarobacter sp.]